MNRIKAQRQWTSAEIGELRIMRRAKVPYAEIAAKLDRSVSAIANAVYVYDLDTSKRPWRAGDVLRVRELAARGYSDRVIGLTIGRSRSAVSQLRDQRGIKSGREIKTGWGKAA